MKTNRSQIAVEPGLVGIDIGATGVRVVELAGVNDKGQVVVARCANVPIPDRHAPGKADCLVTGVIKKAPPVLSALSRALNEAGLSGYGAVVGLTSESSALTRLTLSATLPERKRAKAVRNLDRPISQALPLAGCRISTNFATRLVTKDKKVPQDRLVVAGAAGEEVEHLLALLRTVGVVPRAVDLAVAGTTRALVRTQNHQAVTAVVDIGATKTTVAIREGLHLRYLRVIPEAGDMITRRIARTREISMPEAEALKHRMRLGENLIISAEVIEPGYINDGGPALQTSLTDDTEVGRALEEAGDHLIERIAEAVNSDAKQNATLCTGVLLTGGGALLRGLDHKLAQRLGVGVALQRPWLDLSKCTPKGGNAEDPVQLVHLATAAGLAMWKERY